jgi:hypothetical protein
VYLHVFQSKPCPVSLDQSESLVQASLEHLLG